MLDNWTTSREKITLMLAQHGDWLDGIGGKRLLAHSETFRDQGMSLARLCFADFFQSDMRRCDLVCVRADHATFAEADLREAQLMGACLVCADFRGADLRGANFRKANIEGACFNGADLRGAIFDLSGPPHND